jgi:Na+/proline symporter
MARIMALRDPSALRQARRLTVVWYLFVFLGMWFVGLAGKVLHAELENPETIFFVMLDAHLPAVLAAILLAAVLSAIMSTADSQLLSAAAAIAHDLGLGGDSTKRFLLVSRLSIVLLVGVSVIVAIYLPDKIFSRVLFAWMALGAAFGPTLFARLANIPVTPGGVLLSIITGFSLTVVLSFFPDAPGDIAERLIPFLLAFAVLLVIRQRPTD